MIRRRAGRLIRRLRYRRQQRRLMLPRVIRAFASTYPTATFVEIGANDGDHHDHLKPFILSEDGWTGVMVEPVPYVFERLRRNYGSVPGVTLENCAVSSEAGRSSFFAVREATDAELATLPYWYTGLGSFSREAVMGHVREIPDIADRIVELDVEVIEFSELCRRNQLDGLDLLVIDTEGHDREILRSVDLDRYAPRVILYEHFHLSTQDREATRSELARAGYETKEEGFDTMAVRSGYDDDLARTWARARPAVAAVSADTL